MSNSCRSTLTRTTLSYSVSRHDATAGLGDHGRDGIIQFIEQHNCNRVCKGLKLPLLDVDDVPTKSGKTDNTTDGEPDEEEELHPKPATRQKSKVVLSDDDDDDVVEIDRPAQHPPAKKDATPVLDTIPGLGLHKHPL